MRDLVFECCGARAERQAAAPTVTFRIRVVESAGGTVDGVALRCQLRIEPLQRRYSETEASRLADLFGDRARWGQTMKPLQLAFVTQMVTGFTAGTEVDVPVTLSYDSEVACSRYFSALEDGEIPLRLLFSGSTFAPGEQGLVIEPVPWHKECVYRLPVAVWREAMDALFPNSAWVRMDRDVFAALTDFKSRLGVLSWDEAITTLLQAQGDARR